MAVQAPIVEDPRKWDFKYKDREEMIFKQNALNQWRYDFSQQLTAMVEALNGEFQYVAETRIDITKKAGQVAADRQHVDAQKKAIDGVKSHVDEQKRSVDTTAGQVANNAQQVASDRAAVAKDKQASSQSANAASGSAQAALQARQGAEDLYGDLAAVRDARTGAEQSAQTAGQHAQAAGQARADAGVARAGAEDALRQALEAADAANVDIDEALKAYIPRSGADIGINDLKARLTHNSGFFHIGAYSSAYGTGTLRIYWDASKNQLDMGGAELRKVSIAQANVTGRKPVTDLDLVGAALTDTPVTVFALREEGRSPTFRDDVQGARAAGIYYGLSNPNSPVGNGHYFWSQYASEYQKFLYLPQGVANRAFIGGCHNGEWQTPVELWSSANLNPGDYARFDSNQTWIGTQTFRGSLFMEGPNGAYSRTNARDEGDNTRIYSYSTVPGVGNVAFNQAWYGGSAYTNVTTTNDGVEFDKSLTTPELRLPSGVSITGVSNGLQISRSAGSVEIGNRNSGYTHYSSSAGKHYFYGNVYSQSGFYGDGSNLTGVNAASLSGRSSDESPTANTIAQRSSSGDISARLFRSNYDSTNSDIVVIYTAKASSGDFMRPSTLAQVRAALGLSDLEPDTGSNSNGRYYKYPDGRLVMHCGMVRFYRDPDTLRFALATITLPYKPANDADHYVICNPSSDASSYERGNSAFTIGNMAVKPNRLSSGTVVQVRAIGEGNNTFSFPGGTGHALEMPIMVESRWK